MGTTALEHARRAYEGGKPCMTHKVGGDERSAHEPDIPNRVDESEASRAGLCWEELRCVNEVDLAKENRNKYWHGFISYLQPYKASSADHCINNAIFLFLEF